MAETVLNMLRRAAASAGLTPPSAVVGIQDRVGLMYDNVARKTLKTLINKWDWRVLVKELSLSGATTTLALPSDFERFVISTDVYRSDQTIPLNLVCDLGDWQNYKKVGTQNLFTYTMYDGAVQLLTPLPDGVSLTGLYISNLAVVDYAGNRAAKFVYDVDTVLINEWLFELLATIILKSETGLTVSQTDIETFNTAFLKAKEADSGPREIIGPACASGSNVWPNVVTDNSVYNV